VLSSAPVRHRKQAALTATLDDTLYRAARGGDAVALDQLLRALRPWIVRLLSTRLPRRDDADALGDDIVQEALIHVARSVGECEAKTTAQFLAWARVIVRRRVADERRRAFSLLDPARVSLSYRMPPEEHSCARAALIDAARSDDDVPDVATPRLVIQRAVFAAYERLDASTAELLWLRIVHGATWSDLAAHTVASETAVRRRFERAIARLRTRTVRALCTLPAGIDHVIDPSTPVIRRGKAARVAASNRQRP
jgi:RNA polymerase sigma factor (sigma-70 family)